MATFLADGGSSAPPTPYWVQLGITAGTQNFNTNMTWTVNGGANITALTTSILIPVAGRYSFVCRLITGLNNTVGTVTIGNEMESQLVVNGSTRRGARHLISGVTGANVGRDQSFTDLVSLNAGDTINLRSIIIAGGMTNMVVEAGCFLSVCKVG